MTRWTVAWLCWGAAFFVIEGLAYFRGGYAATLTGHLRAAMLAHPLWAWLIPTLAVGIAIHLLIDYTHA